MTATEMGDYLTSNLDFAFEVSNDSDLHFCKSFVSQVSKYFAFYMLNVYQNNTSR